MHLYKPRETRIYVGLCSCATIMLSLAYPQIQGDAFFFLINPLLLEMSYDYLFKYIITRQQANPNMNRRAVTKEEGE